MATPTIRAIRDDEVAAFRHAIVSTFGGDLATDPEGEQRMRALIAPGRAFAAFDGAQVVGTAATFDFSLTVPGGALPMAGLTMVVVRPTHRRRGVLRALIAAHLDEARGRGIAVSGLWASESSIYGRFGFGIAAEGDDLDFVSRGLELDAAARDEVELLDEAAPHSLASLYDAVRVTRPGMISRSPTWWRYRRFTDRPDMARGASPRRHAVSHRGGARTGYVTYRHRGGWEAGLPTGTVEIEEILATDPRAEATLWQYVANIDLFPNVAWWNAPVDSILPWIVSDPRRIRRRRADTLWLRLDDIAAVLAARGYAADGLLRLQVLDPPTPTERVVELRVAGGVASCAPTAAAPDLRIDRSGLGAMLLGNVRASLLARAGRVVADPAALDRADRMFSTSAPPWCAEIF